MRGRRRRGPDLKLLQEAALRVGKAAVLKRTVISSSSALSAYVRTALAHEPREQFRVLFLDRKCASYGTGQTSGSRLKRAPVM